MPSIKTLTSLVLVIVTVLIITSILTRISQPAEVKAVEGVYDQFFGEPERETSLEYLTLENGKLFLHVERLPRNAVLKLFTFPETPEHRREYTKQSKPVRLSTPEAFLTVYAFSITQGRTRTIHRYVFTHPTKQPISYAELGESITLALTNGVPLETLRTILKEYKLQEGNADLSILVKPAKGVCLQKRFENPRVSFPMCRDERERPLPEAIREGYSDVCLTLLWGSLPRGVECDAYAEAIRMQQQGGQLLLLFHLLSFEEDLRDLPGLSCSQEQSLSALVSHVNTLLQGYSEKNLRELSHMYQFYTTHVFFSFFPVDREDACSRIILTDGRARLRRVQ